MNQRTSKSRPRPTPTRFTEPFWEGTRAGELRIQRCDECGRWRWTPQLACPECLSERCTWVASSGRGKVYSYTVVHRAVDPAAFEAPYILAVVELEEGPHLLTNLVDCSLADVRVDLPVEVRFESIDDEISVYPFAPRSE
jgi:uncharacterized OB-fold protein